MSYIFPRSHGHKVFPFCVKSIFVPSLRSTVDYSFVVCLKPQTDTVSKIQLFLFKSKFIIFGVYSDRNFNFY